MTAEFARLIYEKIGNLIGPVSPHRGAGRGVGDAHGSEHPLNLFWLAHHTV